MREKTATEHTGELIIYQTVSCLNRKQTEKQAEEIKSSFLAHS